MEFDHNNVRLMIEQDRLSSLPDELLHKILSSFDTKFVIQTCVLSSRWEFLWTSMPCFNFSYGQFVSLPKFSKFVTNVLSRHNHQIELSSVKLRFSGAASQVFVKKIANYAISHNVQELTITSYPKKNYQFPPSLFTSKSLKHFTLSNSPFSFPPCLTPKTPWDFPSLTTLYLSDITLCDNHTQNSLDLFSKCVNLTSLTLKMFTIRGVEVFDIITPRLSTLVLIECRRSVSINLIAPQLENLTVVKCSIDYLNVPPGLSSLCYKGSRPRQLSKYGFHSLNKVSIFLSMHYSYTVYEEEDARKTIYMLQEIHSAKYLTLSIDIIECLSHFPDLVSNYPSPFSKLICVTIDSSYRDDAYKVKMSTEVKNYLLANSPNAKFIMELPEAPPTKAMKQKEARAKKKAQNAAEIEALMKEMQALIDQGNMIMDKNEKVEAVVDKCVAISRMEVQIRQMMEKMGKRERAEVEIRLFKQVEEAERQQDRLLADIMKSEEDVGHFKKLISNYKNSLSSYLEASGGRLPLGS